MTFSDKSANDFTMLMAPLIGCLVARGYHIRRYENGTIIHEHQVCESSIIQYCESHDVVKLYPILDDECIKATNRFIEIIPSKGFRAIHDYSEDLHPVFCAAYSVQDNTKALQLTNELPEIRISDDTLYRDFKLSDHLETYGEDLKTVQAASKKYPDRIWTLIECDGETYIVSGFRVIDRICYYISEIGYGQQNLVNHVG